MNFDKVEIYTAAWDQTHLRGHVCVSGDFGEARINITPAISDALVRELHAIIMTVAKAGAEDMRGKHDARED